VARESGFKLDAGELAALEAFRAGTGTLEWAGVGLVFGPNVEEKHHHYPHEVAGDIVPVALHTVRLTEPLLRTATQVRLTELRTVEAAAPPLPGGRLRRRPEKNGAGSGPHSAPTMGPAEPPAPSATRAEAGTGTRPAQPSEPAPASEPVPAQQQAPPAPADAGVREGADTAPAPAPREFVAPLLGWDAATGEEVRWHPAGPGQDVLQNGHTEIWGSSGMGKTQFAMSLLAQLARHSGTRFGIADFKNDYSDDTGFPSQAGAEFLDLWNTGAPYNPLALDDDSDRAIDTSSSRCSGVLLWR